MAKLMAFRGHFSNGFCTFNPENQSICMRKFYTSILVLFLVSSLAFAQSTGDIAFIAYNVDGDDDFAFVALADIPANTTVYFTDNEPDGVGGFTTGEGFLQWDSGASVVAEGTVVVFTDTDSASNGGFGASVGTLSDVGAGSLNLAGGGDSLLAYLGTDEVTPTTFLAGFENASGASSTLVGTGLTAGSTFVSFSSGSPDGGTYTGDRDTEMAFADYLTLIGNTSNWTTNSSDGEALLPFDTTVFTLATLGFEEQNIQSIEIYPNPVAQGFFKIDNTLGQTVRVVVYNTLGKEVINTIYNNNRVDVSALSSGVYIAQFTIGNAVESRKLVIR